MALGRRAMDYAVCTYRADKRGKASDAPTTHTCKCAHTPTGTHTPERGSRCAAITVTVTTQDLVDHVHDSIDISLQLGLNTFHTSYSYRDHVQS